VIAELEAELAITESASCNRGLLAVYADALQARGDIRGELIAVDLALERQDDDDPGLLARRGELLRSWVGDAAVPHVRAHRFGFLDLEASPLALHGAHVHHATTLRLDVERDVGRELSQIADAPRPWLATLVAEHDWWRRPISAEHVCRFVDASPSLRTLRIGQGVVSDYVHPRVTQLLLGEPWIARDPAARSAPFPSLTTLELTAFPDPVVWLAIARFPALAELDLRNMTAATLGSLGIPPMPQELACLWLPPLENDADVAAARELLTQLPTVRRVAVVAHRAGVQLTHPTAEIDQGPQILWPPLASVLRDGLEIQIGDAVYPTNLFEGVHIMNRNYIHMPAAVRAAWDAVWPVIAHLPHDGTWRSVEPATLRTALRGVDLGKPPNYLYPQWVRVRAALRDPSRRDEIAVRWRYA
jgi:hypothetical protein